MLPNPMYMLALLAARLLDVQFFSKVPGDYTGAVSYTHLDVYKRQDC